MPGEPAGNMCELDMRMLHAVVLTMEKLPWDKGMGSAWLRFPILSSAAVSVDIRCKWAYG